MLADVSVDGRTVTDPIPVATRVHGADSGSLAAGQADTSERTHTP